MSNYVVGKTDIEPLKKVVSLWPDLSKTGFIYRDKFGPNKAVSSLRNLPQEILDIIDSYNTPEKADEYRELLGIKERLIPDYTLEGGGLHEIQNGGYLKLHSDFPYRGRLHRRVNLIIFLNEDWKYNGDLELWSPDLKVRLESVKPEIGNLVLFRTTPDSWHGHPDPLICPENVTRKSIALYFYSETRPDSEIEPFRMSKWAARIKNGEIDEKDAEIFDGNKFVVT